MWFFPMQSRGLRLGDLVTVRCPGSALHQQLATVERLIGREVHVRGLDGTERAFDKDEVWLREAVDLGA